ncbi:hypothetical protein SDC9_88530 [bioreactor metagenome]|uniref:Uncharacterized protein n=1 Tax=bioreactor metagenome TaxID=1076179 RepID=A0A644ZLT8_9ZZZZ
MAVVGEELPADRDGAALRPVRGVGALVEHRGGGDVGDLGVLHVRGGLLGHELPVVRQHPAVERDLLHAAVPAVDVAVEVVLGRAEVLLEVGGVLVPGAEPEALVVLDPRDLDGAEVAALEGLRVGGLLARDLDQVAGEVVRPAVEGAGEALGGALVDPADAHAAVPALVEERLDAAVLLPDDHHRVLADVGLQEVALLGDHRVVGEHHPGPLPDLLQLLLVDLLVGEDPAVEAAVLDVDERGDVGVVGHGNSLVNGPAAGPVAGRLGSRGRSGAGTCDCSVVCEADDVDEGLEVSRARAVRLLE